MYYYLLYVVTVESAITFTPSYTDCDGTTPVVVEGDAVTLTYEYGVAQSAVTELSWDKDGSNIFTYDTLLGLNGFSNTYTVPASHAFTSTGHTITITSIASTDAGIYSTSIAATGASPTSAARALPTVITGKTFCQF